MTQTGQYPLLALEILAQESLILLQEIQWFSLLQHKHVLLQLKTQPELFKAAQLSRFKLAQALVFQTRVAPAAPAAEQ